MPVTTFSDRSSRWIRKTVSWLWNGPKECASQLYNYLYYLSPAPLAVSCFGCSLSSWIRMLSWPTGVPSDTLQLPCLVSLWWRPVSKLNELPKNRFWQNGLGLMTVWLKIFFPNQDAKKINETIIRIYSSRNNNQHNSEHCT